MTGDPVGVRSGTSGLLHPLRILGQATDGGLRGGYYRAEFQGFRGVTQGSGMSLDLVGDRIRGRAGRAGNGGDIEHQLFLCR